MTCEMNNSKLGAVVEQLCDEGFDGVTGAMIALFNEAMKLDRSRHLKVSPYERSNERQGYANGFKPKTVKTRIGELALQVPQVRDSEQGFYPSCLEKGLRSERALKAALAEMYIQGVSTRKVKAITEKLCGYEVSSSQVSRVTNELDEQFELWRNRPLEQFKYLVLDARYEKVRHDGSVIDNAVLIAFGVDGNNKRRVLGVSVSLSEAEVHWRAFLESLVSRGMHGIEMIVSDAHFGLAAARRAVFPSVPWQRCQFHLQQNAGAYVPKKHMKKEVGEDIRAVFNAKNKCEAERLLRLTINKYEPIASELAKWLETSIPEGLIVFDLPSHHRKKMRTSNLAERVNKEIKRRTRVVGIFPNVASCTRLVTALLVETDEEWSQGNNYLSMGDN